MSLIVKFYDVEHGSCTHVITPNGKHLLFDIGTKSSTSICRHLKNNYFGKSGKPDMLVITHPHIDHIADLENMYTYDIKPKCLWRDKRAFPLTILTSDRQAQISLKNCANRMSEEYSSAIVDLDNPEAPANNGGVGVTRFTPILEKSDYSDVNNFSCINVIEYGGFKVVITGDNPSAKLIDMLQQSAFKAKIAGATVLLAPHHGRDSDFCKEFVEAVNPSLTVFSDKPIQHETQAYSAQKYYNVTRGVTWNGSPRRVFTTRNDGTITFTFRDNNSWSIDISATEY
ncbi:ComEC/Rec2 family competence protein [Anoxybacterium hadale]|uniref:ComEC/Rec2 family competence protein n=1 Tax=Anoxybacterium hadale TaxID=3408580 RepID=UPI003AFFD3FC